MQEEAEITCPFCGEPLAILLDLSLPQQDYIEDCQVCCRPIQLSIGVDGDNIDSVQADCGS